MGDRVDARAVAMAAATAGAAVLLGIYQLRARKIAADRAALIAATEEPLLTEAEKAVADADAAAAAVAAAPPPPAATPSPADVGPEDVQANLRAVRARIDAARLAVAPSLVAVSKTKPVELLAAAYAEGQRDFGENYVQEVTTKGPLMPPDTRWHFIGHLQTNKVRELVSVPSLHTVHTVDSLKLAHELQKRVKALRPDRPLNVFVQVNTSAEASKSGVALGEAAALCVAVRESCPSLTLRGLMCIGKYSSAEGRADEDFATLASCRGACATALGVEVGSLALSMGMSHDFEAAIRAGATHVRVGSTIFGARAKKP
jgi:pyridoxal phosphate enzyme (YggS family)